MQIVSFVIVIFNHVHRGSKPQKISFRFFRVFGHEVLIAQGSVFISNIVNHNDL
jgi:hypothetical protein